MRRHQALVPLSHDHHHALVQARRLVRAAGSEDAATAAGEFVRFFRADSVRHFREEEEHLFPLVADSEEARPLVVQALLEHQRLHALAARLEREPAEAEVARELGTLLQAHVRLEERELFPLIERLAEAELAGFELPRPEPERLERASQPLVGLASDDLNATVVTWDAGDGTPEHVNEERDVALVVVDGTATVEVDGSERELARGEVLIVEKGRRRRITAGPAGVRYVSVHLRRPPLQLKPAGAWREPGR